MKFNLILCIPQTVDFFHSTSMNTLYYNHMKYFATFSASNCVLKIQEMNYDNSNKNTNILSLYWNLE